MLIVNLIQTAPVRGYFNKLSEIGIDQILTKSQIVSNLCIDSIWTYSLLQHSEQENLFWWDNYTKFHQLVQNFR